MLNEFTFINHAKKFVAQHKVRPALQGIHYKKDGSVVCTDGAVLVQVTNIHDRKQESIVNPKNGEKIIDGTYPVFDNMIKDWVDNHDKKISIDNENLARLLKMLAFMKKGKSTHLNSIVMKFDCDKNIICISEDFTRDWKYSLSIEIEFEGDVSLDEGTYYLNARYLHDVLALLMTESPCPIDIHFSEASKMRPMLFYAGATMALITPIKKSQNEDAGS